MAAKNDKVVVLEDYIGERELGQAIAWLDELGFAQVLALGLEEQYRGLAAADLEPAARDILARLFRATALNAVRLVCLAVETQKISGQTVDWKAVGEMLETELAAADELTCRQYKQDDVS